MGPGDASCDLCQGVDETILHDCSVALFTWAHTVPTDLRTRFFTGKFVEWVHLNLAWDEVEHGDARWRDVWATMCYYLWGWRNKSKHEESFSRPIFPSQCVSDYMHAKASIVPVLRRAYEERWIGWRPPMRGWVRVNTAGVAGVDGGNVGCGGVLHNAYGEWLGGFAKPLGITCAYVAEL